MTARDRFTWDLKCPGCGLKGTAQLSQEDGWSYANGDRSTQVDGIPEGFQVNEIKGNPEFFCIKCNKAAV